MKQNPALARLDVLVGVWEFSSPQFKGAGGRVTFEWVEGGAFLVEHMAGNASWMIGRDEPQESYTILYYDSRGVSRVYQMSLVANLWKIWRNSAGFSQRFTSTLSDDGRTITGFWEKSSDGSNWERDFDITYTKLSAT